MKKILLIEDHTEMRENISEILKLSNYEVIAAENGRVGIEKARQLKPDLIISDIMMPETDGYGVLHALSKTPETAVIPFIFLSAKADKSDIRKGMGLGADDYITKPFNDVELLEAIESRLKKNELLQKNFDRGQEGYEAFVQEVKGFDDLKKLTEESTVRLYKKKDIIMQERQYPRYLFLINSGLVKVFKSNEEGKEFITEMHKAGDYFGYQALLEDRPYSESAEAIEDTEIVLIPKEDFLRLLHSSRQIALKFVKMLSNNLAETEQKLLDMAYNSVRKRVAQALIYVKDKYTSEEPVSAKPVIAFKREDIANIAGTSTESAIRALSDFKSEGLIDIKGSSITLLNPEKLERMRN